MTRALQGRVCKAVCKVCAKAVCKAVGLCFEPCFAHRRCRSRWACRNLGTLASQGHRGASVCKLRDRLTEGPAQSGCQAAELARRQWKLAEAGGPPCSRRSHTTCTCNAGSAPASVKGACPSY